MKKIIFKLAEEKLNEGYSDICILKKATKILRRRTQKFMKTLIEFSGSVAVKPNEKNYRSALCSFLKWLLSGNRELKEELDIKVKVQLETTFANIIYNIKFDRQAGQDRMCHDRNVIAIDIIHYTSMGLISMGLLLRHFDCSNVVLDMLSAPNYGLEIPPLQCLKW